MNTSEGEQSPPPANTYSAHDFTVFAPVNITGGGCNSHQSSFAYNSESGFSSTYPQYGSQQTNDDTISINSTMMNAAPPPDLPRRSISMTSHNNVDVNKPLQSPRVLTPGHSRNSIEIQSASSSKHAISPKLIDCLNEETGSMVIDPLPPPVAERQANIQKTNPHFKSAR